MPHLVGNGTHLYRREVLIPGESGVISENHLVRTPIKVSLSPDAISFYSVAGSYIDGEPAGGVFVTPAQISGYRDASIQASWAMRRLYLHNSALGISTPVWRDGTSAHNLKNLFVFYDGGYHTSYRGGEQAYKPEAYMQIPAYHFTVPEKYSSLSVTGVGLSVTHYGTLFRCGSAGASGGIEPSDGAGHWLEGTYYVKDAPDVLIPSNSDWREDNWKMNVGLYQSLDDNMNNMIANAAETADFATGVTGSGYLPYQLWQGYGTSLIADGQIPVGGPRGQVVQLGGSMAGKFNETHGSGSSKTRGGWLVAMPNAKASTQPSDNILGNRPCYFAHRTDPWRDEMYYYWLCCVFAISGIDLYFDRIP